MTERLKKAVDKYIECGDKKEALASFFFYNTQLSFCNLLLEYLQFEVHFQM